MESKSSGKSNVPMYVAAIVGLVIYGATTYIVTEVAGGTGVHADESNTPNAVVPGPPPFK